MIATKLREMAMLYRTELVNHGGTGPEKMDENTYVTEEFIKSGKYHNHLVWCCEQIMKFADNGSPGSIEVGQQWLGWVQGAMCTLSYYTINEERQHAISPLAEMSED